MDEGMYLFGNNNKAAAGMRRSAVHEQETAETGFRHSTAYHEYFHGYTEQMTELPNGKKKITRVYTAPWIVRNLSSGERTAVRILYWVLYGLAVLLYLVSMSWKSTVTTSRITAMPGLLSAAALIGMLPWMIRQTFQKQRMTWYQFHSVTKKLKNYGMLCCGLLLAAAAAAIYVTVSGRAADAGVCCVQIMMLLASAVLTGSIAFIEKRIGFHEETNENKPLEDGVRIY